MFRGPGKLALLISLAVASCQAHDGADPKAPGPIPQAKGDRPEALKTLDAKLQKLVDEATDDLVDRLQTGSIEIPHVEVLEARRVTWRSSALGCPMPDRGYTMVLTPGVLIRLRAAGGIYEYHSTPRGPAFLCEPPGRIETPAPRDHSQDPT